MRGFIHPLGIFIMLTVAFVIGSVTILATKQQYIGRRFDFLCQSLPNLGICSSPSPFPTPCISPVVNLQRSSDKPLATGIPVPSNVPLGDLPPCPSPADFTPKPDQSPCPIVNIFGVNIFGCSPPPTPSSSPSSPPVGILQTPLPSGFDKCDPRFGSYNPDCPKIVP